MKTTHVTPYPELEEASDSDTQLLTICDGLVLLAARRNVGHQNHTRKSRAARHASHSFANAVVSDHHISTSVQFLRKMGKTF